MFKWEALDLDEPTEDVLMPRWLGLASGFMGGLVEIPLADLLIMLLFLPCLYDNVSCI